MCLGFLLNLFVVVLNGGRMPVSMHDIPEKLRSRYEVMHPGTRAWFLGDWIRIGRCYISPGDIALFLSLIVVIARALFASS
jgi:hypothetical protein